MKTNYPPRRGPWVPASNLRASSVTRNITIPNRSIGPGSTNISSSTNQTIYQRTWTGSRTPNFGAKKVAGTLPVNAHSVYILESQPGLAFREEIWVPPGSPADSSLRSGSYTWLNGAGTGIPPLAQHLLGNRNLALRRLQKTVSTGANLALDLLEYNQFLRMVSNTAMRITGSVKALKKGNLPGAVNALWQGKKPRYRKGGGPSVKKGLAENWLELQYGWKPLLGDVKAAAEAIALLELSGREVHQIKSSAVERLVTKEPIIQQLPTNIKVGVSEWLKITHIKFGIRYKVDSQITNFLAQTGFTNPLNLAWEVIPFSFVVDWFIGVGPYLESLSSWDGLTFLSGYETRFTRENMDRSYGWEVKLNSTHYDRGYGHESMKAIRLDRIKLTSFPTQSPPRFKNPFSVTHAANALALLKVVFLR